MIDEIEQGIAGRIADEIDHLAVQGAPRCFLAHQPGCRHDDKDNQRHDRERRIVGQGGGKPWCRITAPFLRCLLRH